MSTDSMEPFIDNLWYYDSVVNPKPCHDTIPSPHSDELPAESLPLSSGGQISFPTDHAANPYPNPNPRPECSPDSFPSPNPNPTPKPNTNSSPPGLQPAMAQDFEGEDSPQMQELHRVFDAMDEDHDGEVSGGDLCTWVKKLGLEFTEEGMVRMVTRADTDRKGSLDFKEFVSLNRAVEAEEEEEELEGTEEEGKLAHMALLSEVFQLFDRDHNGLISSQDLRVTLENLGLLKKAKDSEYTDMIKRVDADGDGQVSFSEFQKMMDENSVDFH